MLRQDTPLAPLKKGGRLGRCLAGCLLCLIASCALPLFPAASADEPVLLIDRAGRAI